MGKTDEQQTADLVNKKIAADEPISGVILDYQQRQHEAAEAIMAEYMDKTMARIAEEVMATLEGTDDGQG